MVQTWCKRDKVMVNKNFQTTNSRDLQRKYSLPHLETFNYLIKHPLEANCCRTMVLRSTTEPVQIVNLIQSLYNCSNIFSPIQNRKHLSIGTYINMTVQKTLKPSTSWPLHRNDSKESYWIVEAFSPERTQKEVFSRLKLPKSWVKAWISNTC